MIRQKIQADMLLSGLIAFGFLAMGDNGDPPKSAVEFTRTRFYANIYISISSLLSFSAILGYPLLCDFRDLGSLSFLKVQSPFHSQPRYRTLPTRVVSDAVDIYNYKL